jgi:hypothetical protein
VCVGAFAVLTNALSGCSPGDASSSTPTPAGCAPQPCYVVDGIETRGLGVEKWQAAPDVYLSPGHQVVRVTVQMRNVGGAPLSANPALVMLEDGTHGWDLWDPLLTHDGSCAAPDVTMLQPGQLLGPFHQCYSIRGPLSGPFEIGQLHPKYGVSSPFTGPA